jgi:hypothetical protein
MKPKRKKEEKNPMKVDLYKTRSEENSYSSDSTLSSSLDLSKTMPKNRDIK